MTVRLGEVLEKHTVVVLNEALKKGFTQMPNFVLRDKQLSYGARLAYAILLSYAWQEESCFPGQERMAADLGAEVRSIRRYLNELRAAAYIDWKQRGLNRTNVYYLLDVKPLDRTVVSGPDRTGRSDLERTPESA